MQYLQYNDNKRNKCYQNLYSLANGGRQNAPEGEPWLEVGGDLIVTNDQGW